MKLFVMSDIHGTLSKFESMIEKIDLKREDKLIILGDNIDRGEQSIEAVMKILELKEKGYQIITLMGNHEEMFLEVVEKYSSVSEALSSVDVNILIHNGTMKTLAQYYELPKKTQDIFLDEIKEYKDYHIEEDFLFVHAGVSPGIPLNEQKGEDLRWIREEFIYKESHGLPYTIVFGHTPTRYINKDNSNQVWREKDKIGIDCGAAYGGKLACINLSDNIVYYE